MDKSWISIQNKGHPLYEKGAEDFVEFASANRPNAERILCPCKKCRNMIYVKKGDVVEHILLNRFLESYTCWTFHGESSSSSNPSCDFVAGDDMREMIHDAFGIPSIGPLNFMENVKSAKNKAIRRKLTTPHTSGRTPRAEVRNKLAKSNGYEPTRRMVYKETHVIIGKGPVNEIAAKTIQEMDELEAQNPETGVARDNTYGRVMGRDRHGRVGTYGLGATPTMVFGPSYKLSQDERREIETQHQQQLETLRHEIEAENEKVRREMAAEYERKQTEMKEQMELQMQEKLSAMESRMSDRMEAQMRNLLESHMRDMGNFLHSPRDVSSGTGQIPDDANFDPITSSPILHHSARFQSEVQSKRQPQPPKYTQLQPPKQTQPQTIPRSKLRNYCEDLMVVKRVKKNLVDENVN